MSGNLFVYGTLTLPAVMHGLIDREVTSHTASLEGYARYRVDRESYPGIVREKGAETEGRVYLEVEQQELELLDRYEGDLYERKSVEVQLADGNIVSAEVYIVREQFRGVLTREPWSPSNLVKIPFSSLVAARRRPEDDPSD